MTVSIDDVVRVVMSWAAPNAQLAQNVWHLKMVSGAGASEANILTAVETQMQTMWGAISSNATSSYSADLLELFNWDFGTHQWNGVGSKAISGVAGSSGSDWMPHGVAVVGLIGTEYLRRTGRTFLPGFVEGAINAGILGSTALAAALTAVGYFDTDISVTGGLLTWCTFNTAPASALYETASLAVQSVSVSDIPGYQRRRKPGVGV